MIQYGKGEVQGFISVDKLSLDQYGNTNINSFKFLAVDKAFDLEVCLFFKKFFRDQKVMVYQVYLFKKLERNTKIYSLIHSTKVALLIREYLPYFWARIQQLVEKKKYQNCGLEHTQEVKIPILI